MKSLSKPRCTIWEWFHRERYCDCEPATYVQEGQSWLSQIRKRLNERSEALGSSPPPFLRDPGNLTGTSNTCKDRLTTAKSVMPWSAGNYLMTRAPLKPWNQTPPGEVAHKKDSSNLPSSLRAALPLGLLQNCPTCYPILPVLVKISNILLECFNNW